MAALKRNSYDCILVDLDMPGLSGIEVIAKAKELGLNRGGRAHRQIVARYGHFRAPPGAFDYLTKPCKLAELQALLTRVAAKAN